MRKLLLWSFAPVLAIILVSSCADPDTLPCRIVKFYWEDEWHAAAYNSAGRLATLTADNSKVAFYYDDLNRLVAAEIFTGDPTPFYKFEFTHGPHGIVQADEYHPSALGTEHNRTIYHYASPSRVDYLIHQEFGYDETLGFEIRKDLTYASNNVTYVEGSSAFIHTDYVAGKYDRKRNPFRALAAAVGNNAFFPVCFMVSFPVSKYDISYLNIFSQNNPLRASYEITGSGLDPEEQAFNYAYNGSVAKEIVWKNSSYGTTTSEDYAFEFECGRRRGNE